jgi:aspartate oxidase
LDEVALIIAEAVLYNRQSRGCHDRDDSVSPNEGEKLIKVLPDTGIRLLHY